MPCYCLFEAIYILETDMLKTVANAFAIDDKGNKHYMVKSNDQHHFIINFPNCDTFTFSYIDHSGSDEKTCIVPHNQSHDKNKINECGKYIIKYIFKELIESFDKKNYIKLSPEWENTK
jgi:hypothetical protein